MMVTSLGFSAPSLASFDTVIFLLYCIASQTGILTNKHWRRMNVCLSRKLLNVKGYLIGRRVHEKIGVERFPFKN